MKKFLTLALMLCACAGIHAQSRIIGATAVTAPCEGVPNIVIMGEATPKQIADAQKEQKRRCDEKNALGEGTQKGSTELH